MDAGWPEVTSTDRIRGYAGAILPGSGRKSDVIHLAVHLVQGNPIVMALC